MVYAKFVNLNPGKANSPADFVTELACRYMLPESLAIPILINHFKLIIAMCKHTKEKSVKA